MIEGDGEITLRADLPGIASDEVTIELEDSVLTISGEHEEASEEQRGAYVRRERQYGSFSRSVHVPSSVKAEEIEASYDDGVLEVRVPVAHGAPQTVEVKTKSEGAAS